MKSLLPRLMYCFYYRESCEQGQQPMTSDNKKTKGQTVKSFWGERTWSIRQLKHNIVHTKQQYTSCISVSVSNVSRQRRACKQRSNYQKDRKKHNDVHWKTPIHCIWDRNINQAKRAFSFLWHNATKVDICVSLSAFNDNTIRLKRVCVVFTFECSCFYCLWKTW